MDFEMLAGDTVNSFSTEVREMTPLARWELVSKVPDECWLLSNHQKSSYSLG